VPSSFCQRFFTTKTTAKTRRKHQSNRQDRQARQENEDGIISSKSNRTAETRREDYSRRVNTLVLLASLGGLGVLGGSNIAFASLGG
jgi:hypothetical protein